jgi:PHD/YefM family antitoxin component YafN of YafNO toxin-antitoxin module
METLAPMNTPRHIDESLLAAGYAIVLSQVAADQRPVVVQRDGIDIAAVIPVEYLEVIRDSLARQEAERIAEGIDWSQKAGNLAPSQAWFDEDEPKPF